MKRLFIALVTGLLLVVLMAVISPVMAEQTTVTQDEAVRFVTETAANITQLKDTPDMLFNNGNHFVDLDKKALFQPYFGILDMKASADAENPQLVHYSCKIPGLVGQAHNAVLGVFFPKNDKYSPMVNLEGTVRVIRDQTGNLRIDISDSLEPNPFTLFAALRYTDRSLFDTNGKALPDNVILEDRQGSLNKLLNLGCFLYGRALGKDQQQYADETVLPELENYSEHFSNEISHLSNRNGYANYYLLRHPLILGLLGVSIAILLFFIIKAIVKKKQIGREKKLKARPVLDEIAPNADRERRRELEKRAKSNDYASIYKTGSGFGSGLSWPADKEMITWLISEKHGKVMPHTVESMSWKESGDLIRQIVSDSDDRIVRETALQKIPYPEGRDILYKAAMEDPDHSCRMAALKNIPWLTAPEVWLKALMDNMLDGKMHTDVPEDAYLKVAITLALHPLNTDGILRRLCLWIEQGMTREADPKSISLAGWAAAALGRILTAQMKPEDIAPNQERFSAAINCHNTDASRARALQKDLDQYANSPFGLTDEMRQLAQPKVNEMKTLTDRLSGGLGIYMLENGDLPFTYLTFILRDSQSETPRFIKQGVIMGLVDWLGRNAGQSDAKELLESVVQIRADMIRSDDDLTFFEVRVPSDCSGENYAAVLAEVLRCSNPSVHFCDTAALIKIAEKEVPGCMDMLRVCPLRLIDPVNRQTMGFYQFKPYIHAMWVHYQQPKGSGKVISRKHEVDDRTKPLSSGLNLKLFLNPYAVIPTIFHEYQHFCGDPNEASVFLKTQLFSIRFYKTYREANASADGVFAQMTAMLGMPPAAEKVDMLNSTIRNYYGEQITRPIAEQKAENELDRLNKAIATINANETWDQAVSFPLLNENEDAQNAKLIREILIRFATVPKSISKSAFADIVKNG